MEMKEKAEELLAYLITKGFKPKNFVNECRNAGSQFNVEVSKSYGDELMEYRLNFSWDHQFDTYRWTGYKATYSHEDGRVRSQDFIASNAGICHAHLAYHVLSGRLEDIREKLMKTGIEEYTSTDINGFLETMLSRNPDTFTFNSSKNDKEGLIDFRIDVTLTGERYEPGDVTATFVRYPEILHGIFNGIDTLELAKAMAAIDWNRNDLFSLREDEDPVLSPTVEELFNQVMKLSSDENGKSVAMNLQLQHWSEASYFEAFVHDEAWEMYHKQPKTVISLPLETGARKIYNLMCGRPVIMGRLTDIEDEFNTWQKLVQTSQGVSLALVEGPSRKELETYLSMLPLDDLHKTSLLIGLFNGDICNTTLYGLQHTEVIISPDLPAKTLRLTTPEGAIIPYNFKLEQAEEPKNVPPQSRIQQKPSPIKKKKKHKGRGI